MLDKYFKFKISLVFVSLKFNLPELKTTALKHKLQDI